MPKPSPVLPESMVPELAAWNNGRGIDLESWIACSGDFKLAVGYSSVFWPRFELYDDYILGSSGIVGGFLIGQDGASAAERTLLDWLVIGSRRLGAPILVGGVSLLCVAIGGTGSKAVAVIKARRAPWRGRSRLAGALE